MDEQQVVEQLQDWITEVLPELESTYAFVPSGKPGALPDAIVDVAAARVSLEGETFFPIRNIQQRLLVIFESSIAIMVDNSDEGVAADQLRDFSSRIRAALLSSITLGERVPVRSPLLEVDFTQPFVEYEDGTKGREMTVTLVVGDLVEADEL